MSLSLWSSLFLVSFFTISALASTSSSSSESVEEKTGSDSCVFFTIGDWGSGDDIQKKVAHVMNSESDKRKPGYVLALGDNFYENGVLGVNDPQWKHKYTNMYTADGLNVPFYAILGNHDHHWNPEVRNENITITMTI